MRGAASTPTLTSTLTTPKVMIRSSTSSSSSPSSLLVAAAARLALSGGSRKTMGSSFSCFCTLGAAAGRANGGSEGRKTTAAMASTTKSIFGGRRFLSSSSLSTPSTSFSSPRPRAPLLVSLRRGSLLPAAAAMPHSSHSYSSSSSPGNSRSGNSSSTGDKASPLASAFERFRRARWPPGAVAATADDGGGPGPGDGDRDDAAASPSSAGARSPSPSPPGLGRQPAKLVVPPPPAPSPDAPDWAGTTFAGDAAEDYGNDDYETASEAEARSSGSPASVASASTSYSTVSSLDIDEDTGLPRPLPPASPLDVRRRVFCNRSLNMRSIRAVGFDMDYTLAQYKPETFEALAYSLTVDKLVTAFGYPDIIRDFEFDWRYMARGLTIDKARGNVLKIDRHKYVKLAYHGFSEMAREDRLATYARTSEAFDYDEPDFALIDTLFSLAEAHLFMQLVELAEAAPEVMPRGKSMYGDLYRDVRAAVDLCHRDGSLKSAVAADPAQYIHEDRKLAPLLRTLRNSGRRVFLATNSLWDYTDVVMRHLLGGGVNASTGAPRWLDLFDVVVTGCGKPAFFKETRPLLEVDPATGLLRNTDSGTPMVPIGDADLPSRGGTAGATKSAATPAAAGAPSFASGASTSTTHPSSQMASRRGPARVFQGGTYLDLHRRLGISSGAEVLYVGDHIYGDILRSKKTLGWRTMLVVPELEAELDILSRQTDVAAEMRALRAARDALEDQIQRLEWALEHNGGSGSALMTDGDDDGGGAPGDRGPAGAIIDSLKSQRDEVREKHRALLKAHHESFHAVWGRLLKAGYQNSRYAHQVQRFACLYSSHVSNLAFYSPEKSWRATPDAMAHEEDPQLLAGARARSRRKMMGEFDGDDDDSGRDAAVGAGASAKGGMTDEGASSSEIS